jgi:ABC-type uncharacterized transport system permease subunit
VVNVSLVLMEVLATISFSLAVIAYSVASTQFFLDLARKRGASSSEAPVRILLFGALLHLVQIVTTSLFSRTCPVESMRFALSLAALVSVVVFLILRRGRRLDALGSFVGPVSLTFLVSAQFIGESVAVEGVSRALLAFHVTANLLGLGFVLLAGGASAFYVFVDARLKAKRLGAMGRLPSLDVLDMMGHRMLLMGFPLLTVGAVSGGLFFSQIDVTSAVSLVRAVLGYAAWLLVAVVLLLRNLWGWDGRRSAYGTLLGVLCVSLVLLMYLFRPLLGGAV